MASTMSVTRPVRKEIAELKRPDLKGQYICVTCGQSFQHCASLNRHRTNSHSNEHTCRLCNESINATETVREHMVRHGKTRIYTCGCCNWSFESKKLMTEHTQSMRKTGGPGTVEPLAVSSHQPGSLLQSVIQGRPMAKAVRKIRGSVSVSSSSRSCSPPSGNNTPPQSNDVLDLHDMPKLERMDLVEQVREKEKVAVANVVKKTTDLSAVFASIRSSNLPYIASFEHAVMFVSESIQLKEDEYSDEVWKQIALFAVQIVGVGR